MVDFRAQSLCFFLSSSICQLPLLFVNFPFTALELNLVITTAHTLGQVANSLDGLVWFCPPPRSRGEELEKNMRHLQQVVAAALLAALMQTPALAATDAGSSKDGEATSQAKPVSTIEQHRAKAAKGNAESQYALALAHAGGLEVKHDVKAAVGWFEKAAAQGHMESQYELGIIYAEGAGEGLVPKNSGKAADWFQKSAQRGHPQAQWRLSLLFEQGRGVKKDFIEAYKWASVAINVAGRGSQLWRNGSPRLYRLRWKVPHKEFVKVEKWVLAWRAQK